MAKKLLALTFSLLTIAAFAGGALQVARAQQAKQINQIIAKKPRAKIKAAKRTPHKLKSVRVIFTLTPGSLKQNLKRIAAHYGWRNLVWQASEDFKWYGVATIKAPTLSQALGQVLANYPLQAVFYHGNHILAIEPRTLYVPQGRLTV